MPPGTGCGGAESAAIEAGTSCGSTFLFERGASPPPPPITEVEAAVTAEEIASFSSKVGSVRLAKEDVVVVIINRLVPNSVFASSTRRDAERGDTDSSLFPDEAVEGLETSFSRTSTTRRFESVLIAIEEEEEVS
jgi:hypothetical protein